MKHEPKHKCTTCGPAKFKTESKAKKTYKCRKCGKVTANVITTCGALGQPA
jgi:ribosomal protein L37AE/L43A